MFRLLPRALGLALIGAGTASIGFALSFAAHPAFELEMDRELPREVSGVYPVERDRDDTFAWTTDHAAMTLDEFPRRSAWICTVRLRGARPAGVPQPLVTVAVDDGPAVAVTATNEYEDVAVDVPIREDAGLRLSVEVASTFVPSPADPRTLGVQVDRIGCAPVTWTPPPAGATAGAAMSGALFGALLGLLGLPLFAAMPLVLIFAVAVSVPLSSGLAPYGAYSARAPWITGWVGLAALSGAKVGARARRVPLATTALVAVAMSAGAMTVELLTLVHPSKPLVDALFHAHRLEWVLDGRYYFTQPLPDGVQFPYAIALYVVSAPWSLLAGDHVTLLRAVVIAAHALAGLSMYAVIVREWRDPAAAVTAVALFHLVPLPFAVIGNANLTYAFGASMAAMTLAAAATWALGFGGWLALTLLAGVTFLSHVGVVPVLFGVLLATGAAYGWLGRRALRAPARAVVAAALVAAAVSVVSYYAHFGDAYRSLSSVRAQAASAPSEANASRPDMTPETARPSARASTPFRRLARAAVLALDAFGPALLLLAVIGAWRALAGGDRDRLTLLVFASLAVFVAAIGVWAATPVKSGFERYTEEFVVRLDYATIPAVVILASRAMSWAWTLGATARAVSALLAVALGYGGVRAWLAWLA
jgi:hypothetical protein